jgi:two-component system chemotaxis response regulator CheY
MRKRILLVDDVVFMRKMWREMLESAGYDVAGEATDGTEVAELYETIKPDLVIMDIVMPKWDGIYTLTRLKNSNPEAKVMFCSVMGQPHIVVESLQMGAVDFVVKPFKQERFLAGVDFTLHAEPFVNASRLPLVHKLCSENMEVLQQEIVDQIIECVAHADSDLFYPIMEKLLKADAGESGRASQTEWNQRKTLRLLKKIAQSQEEIIELLQRLTQ